jgi:hypothetical protein
MDWWIAGFMDWRSLSNPAIHQSTDPLTHQSNQPLAKAETL